MLGLVGSESETSFFAALGGATCFKCIRGHLQTIIELVDSICRDSADTQYMLKQKNFAKSPK